MPAIDCLFLEICNLYCQTKDSVKSCRNGENIALNLSSEPRAQVSEWLFPTVYYTEICPTQFKGNMIKTDIILLDPNCFLFFFLSSFIAGTWVVKKKKKTYKTMWTLSRLMALHLPVYLLLPSQKILHAAPTHPIFIQVASASPLPATYPSSVTITSSLLLLPPERWSSNTKWWRDSWSTPTGGSLLTPRDVTALLLDDVTHLRWRAKAFLVAPE